MSSPDKQSIIVRVEVEIPGMGRVTTQTSPHRVTSSIGYPGATATVRVSGGVGYICASGKSKNGDGVAARTVFAKIFPGGTTVFGDPPQGTQATRPAADGSWSFDGEGLDVKGAASDAGGTAGNVLVIWADYGTDPLVPEAFPFNGRASTVGATDCHGGNGGSGSGSGCGSTSGSASGSNQASAIDGLTVAGKLLHATFMGSLSSLGTLVLHWNGVYWMGMVPATGALLSFFVANSNCTLGCAGEGVAFMVAAPPTSFAPFSWSAQGTISSKNPGGFAVIVTE